MLYLGWLRDNITGVTQHLIELHGHKRRFVDDAELEHLREKGPAPLRRCECNAGRNDPCPCGSGKKYKKCCLT